MKIPKSIVILGRKFSVKMATSDQLKEATGFASVGACNYSKKLILLHKEMSKEDQLITLFHEVAHVIQITVGLSQVTTPEMTEVWCETMANGFLDLAKQIK